MNKKIKIIVFGLSEDGKKLIKDLFPMILCKAIEVVCICDNDSRLKGQKFQNIKIENLNKIKKYDFDKIIVTPIFFEAIKKQLVSLGISEKKIIPYYHDYETYFGYKKRFFNNLEIGPYSYFKPSTAIHNAVIGSFCHIGSNCNIGQIGHNPSLTSTYPLRYHFSEEINDCTEDTTGVSEGVGSGNEKTIIGNDVYIGTGVTIKSGVKVGDGCVIASRAFVTKDIEDYSIVAGIPAKVIKKRFDEDQIGKLLKIKWWEHDNKSITENINLLDKSIDDFLKLNTF
jgi:acetyltransferase-like isoleucine patch superfamily enzyme